MSSGSKNIEDILCEAVDIESTEQRNAYLDKACGDDRNLRQRLAKLVADHFDAGDFLERPAAPAVEIEGFGVNSQIGCYKLLQQIGEGGFGVVYMAEQSRPVSRKVALKIIKPGMDSREVIARFEAERQALAMMDHPNIARVLDAGQTDTGRPYFAMELVRGVPITEYADKNLLTTRNRLELFVTVCRAVQHAHHKGIIHRDIKPSNVMVTLHDGTPVVKVIDFGVAKALNQKLTAKTLFTAYGQMIGTPQYMSPEQSEMSGLDIDTRSDVYSLGVLLYELLTGATPFDATELLVSGLNEMRKIIQEREPQRPSTKVATLQAEERTTTANRRGVDIHKLTVLLRGDLDWIVMKCLEKDRTRRYETANELVRDLTCHFTNEPITARPPSTAYRLQKMWRKNRLAYSAIVAVATALILGTCVSAWQAMRATEASTDATLAQAGEKQQRIAAVAAQKVAEDQRATAERYLYVANMNLAQEAWTQKDNGRLQHLLDETIAYPEKRFEWYYWQRQAHRAVKTLRGHTDRVFGVAFSPDGDRIVTASGDHTATVWEVATGRRLFTLRGHGTWVHSAIFSPDDQRILTTSWDGTAKIWDSHGGEELFTLAHKVYRIGSMLGAAAHPSWPAAVTKDL